MFEALLRRTCLPGLVLVDAQFVRNVAECKGRRNNNKIIRPKNDTAMFKTLLGGGGSVCPWVSLLQFFLVVHLGWCHIWHMEIIFFSIWKKNKISSY